MGSGQLALRVGPGAPRLTAAVGAPGRRAPTAADLAVGTILDTENEISAEDGGSVLRMSKVAPALADHAWVGVLVGQKRRSSSAWVKIVGVRPGPAHRRPS